MKPRAFITLLVSTVIPCAAGAEAVFRCLENGRMVFTDTATGLSCQRLDLKVYQPDSGEITRQQDQLDAWKDRRDEEVSRILDREAAARTQRQQVESRALGRSRVRDEMSSGHPPSRRNRHQAGHGTKAPSPEPTMPAPDMIGPRD